MSTPLGALQEEACRCDLASHAAFTGGTLTGAGWARLSEGVVPASRGFHQDTGLDAIADDHAGFRRRRMRAAVLTRGARLSGIDCARAENLRGNVWMRSGAR